MNHIIIVTGERDWKDKETVYRVLNEELRDHVQRWALRHSVHDQSEPWFNNDTAYLAAAHSAFVLRHGVAEGADWIANDWARERGVTVERFPAQWKDPITGQYNAGAGPQRNREMAKKEPKASKVVAFWSGKMRMKFGKKEYSGTFDMIQAGLGEGIPVSVTPPKSA